MKFRHWGAAMALALLAGGPALSADQLRQSVANQLAEHNITIANFDALSDTQVSQLELILSTNEGGDAQKQAMVENLLNEKAPCEGNPQLRQQVADQLKEHGIQVQNFDNITGTQLVVIKSVLDSSAESDDAKKGQIERIFAVKKPVVGGDYLVNDATHCIRKVGADLDVNTLTPDEMLQIQLIVDGPDDMNTKKKKVEAFGDD